MTEMTGTTRYNRTLDMSLARVPYAHYEARTAVFRKHGVRTAYTFSEKAFVPIMYRKTHFDPGPARDFARSATAWELTHSKVPFGDGNGSVHPVVDQDGLVIGHYGSFDSNSVFVPADIPSNGKVVERPVRGVYVPGWRAVEVVRTTLDLRDYLELGADVIADRRPKAKHSGYTNYHTPQTSFSVITDIEGHVLLVLDSRNKDGVTPSSFSPLDLISVLKLIVFGASAALGAVAIRTLMRRRAAKALAQSGKRELTSGSGIATEIAAVVARVIRGDPPTVSLGRFGEPASLFASVVTRDNKVIYQVTAIILRGGGDEAAVALARGAHREMIKRAAQQAQKLGQKQFKMVGKQANKNFREHADNLAKDIGVPRSGKDLGRSGGKEAYSDYEVTLDVGKVLSSNP